MSSKYHTFAQFYPETYPLGTLSVGGVFVFPSKQSQQDLRVVTAVDKTEVYHRKHMDPNDQPTKDLSDRDVVPVLNFGTIQVLERED